MTDTARTCRTAIALLAGLCIATAAAEARPARKAAEKPKPDATDVLTPRDKEFPLGTTWALKSLNDKSVPVNDELTFSVDKDYRGSGFSGCNTWSATIYPVKQQHLLVGPFALTRKECEKPRMQFETSYLNALRANAVWDLVDGDLVVKGQAGTLRFQRAI